MMGNYDILYSPQKPNLNLGLVSIKTCFITVVGCLGPILIPPVHILVVYSFWRTYNRVINKNLCSCSCWDSIFKGPYESGIASYKHVYFNSTSNSFKIWSLTVISILMLYEAIRRLMGLTLQKRVRYPMVILFVTSMFSHYYSWWMFFNYWNDEFYSQWYHQLFFTLTELASSAVVLLLADKLVTFNAPRALTIAAIGTVHIMASGWDQFVLNVVRGEGYSYQVIRDIGFMVPDILHVVIPIWQLKTNRDRSIERKDLALFSSIVGAGLIISAFL